MDLGPGPIRRASFASRKHGNYVTKGKICFHSMTFTLLNLGKNEAQPKVAKLIGLGTFWHNDVD